MKNKNKNILRLIALACISCMYACVNDKGNYDYIPKEGLFPVEITGLKDSSFLLRTTVELHPTIKGLDEDLSKYDFLWYTYPEGVSGYAPQRDTIGHSPDLSFVITYPPGETRVLIFEIKEKRTGVMANQKVRITTSSIFSRGWFVVNDLSDQTDVDFITPSGEVSEDVISQANGQKLEGKGVKILLHSSYYHDKLMPDGKLTRLSNQVVFHVLSDRDMKTVNASSMEVYKNWEDEFFTPPAVRKPQDVFAGAFGGAFLINDGKLHAIMGMMSGPGKFGYAKLGDPDLYPCIVIDDYAWDAVVFGRTTSSFLSGGSGAELANVVSGSGIQAVNMDYDMLWMQLRSSSYLALAWAIMQSKSLPTEYYLVDIDAYGTYNPIVEFHLLNPAARVLAADVYGIHQEHTAAFYFAKGNLLSYFQKGDSLGDDEVDLYTFPAGETISYVGKNSTTTNLEVLTNSGNTWKLYIFSLAGNGQYAYLADNTPLAVYSGNGNARFVLYR
ncbi:MAG: hypothetical protein LBI96_07905 [Odoribacteraceae bacterium]|jgi:hypothetical protein|nr:hypothetical protein [Odoribacteraceae bacterium]